MKPATVIIALLFLCYRCVAQKDSLLQQIDTQVWVPFIAAFNSGDDKAFRLVHSKDIVRVERDNRNIYGYEQYFQEIPDSTKAKWRDWKKQIELRFVQRIAAHDKAFETGYYKTTSRNVTTGETRESIGRFHVLLRRENGVWKILMDADTGEGASEEAFNKALPLK